MANQRQRIHFALFVPGAPKSLDEWQRLLAAKGLTSAGTTLRGAGLPSEIATEWVENPKDGSFGQAFSFGTASAERQRQISAAPGALVLSVPVDLHRERPAIASLGHTLASCGALAVRIEQSKLGYPIDRWLALMDASDPWTLYRAAVVVLESKSSVATCGMHAFSLPDAQLALDDTTAATEASKLLGVLNVYQIAEGPVLASGHTFSPDAQTPRRVLHRWPDATYPAGSACHNPFGVWRLGPPGSSGTASELALVFMPPLVSVLMAMEEEAGKPLSQEQVQELTSKGLCMAMPHREAQALERSRRHADLDPERAWEQWQIVRRRTGSSGSRQDSR